MTTPVLVTYEESLLRPESTLQDYRDLGVPEIVILNPSSRIDSVTIAGVPVDLAPIWRIFS